jgi:predicted nuclease with TOPRIM domain
MNDIKKNLEELTDDFEEMVEKLKEERDELGVKLHLAKMEASEEWQELEHKWSKLETKVQQMGGAAAESSGDILAAAQLLGQEIKAGFKRIAKQL